MMSAPNICAFGDSLTAGFGLLQTESLPGQLQNRLQARGYRVRIHNHGISGETTGDGLLRIHQALRPRPDLVLLELGINDFLLGIPAGTIKTNLDQLIRACLLTGATVLLAGFTAVPGMDPEESRAFNALYPDLAQGHDLTLFPDFLGPLLGDPDLTLPDGLHPNAQGIANVVDRLEPVLIPLLNQKITP